MLKRWQERLALSPEDLETLGLELRGLAFTLADVWNTNFLSDVQDTLAESIAAGENEAAWTARVQEVLDRYGSDETLAGVTDSWDASYVDLVFRQNTINAFQAGRYAEQFSPERMASDGYWLFAAVEDERLCEICAPLDGMVFAKSDPDARQYLPGLHFACRCMSIELDDTGVQDGGYNVSSGKGLVYTDDNGDVRDLRPDPGFDVDKVAQLVPDIFRRIAA